MYKSMVIYFEGQTYWEADAMSEMGEEDASACGCLTQRKSKPQRST
jgi:hypothetical protein